MELAKYNEYLISTVGTDGLVQKHQGISTHSAECAPMCLWVNALRPEQFI